jgi:hypothetical protein
MVFFSSVDTRRGSEFNRFVLNMVVKAIKREYQLK